VKQSIYRFRQADPTIFQQYIQRQGWKTIPLSENFRSHEGLLNFVNPLFRWLMKREFGGLEYTEEAALKFGNAAERVEMQAIPGARPSVELHLLLTDQEPERDDNNEEEPEIENAELEARDVALRLRELKESGFTIYDEKEQQRSR
jgi:ATP-dependent helicase/nuclease subunit A